MSNEQYSNAAMRRYSYGIIVDQSSTTVQQYNNAATERQAMDHRVRFIAVLLYCPLFIVY